MIILCEFIAVPSRLENRDICDVIYCDYEVVDNMRWEFRTGGLGGRCGIGGMGPWRVTAVRRQG